MDEILKVGDYVRITKGSHCNKRGKISWMENRPTDNVMEYHIELEANQGFTTAVEGQLERYHG